MYTHNRLSNYIRNKSSYDKAEKLSDSMRSSCPKASHIIDNAIEVSKNLPSGSISGYMATNIAQAVFYRRSVL